MLRTPASTGGKVVAAMDFKGRNIEAAAQSFQPAPKFGVIGRGVIEYEGISRGFRNVVVVVSPPV